MGETFGERERRVSQESLFAPQNYVFASILRRQEREIRGSVLE